MVNSDGYRSVFWTSFVCVALPGTSLASYNFCKGQGNETITKEHSNGTSASCTKHIGDG